MSNDALIIELVGKVNERLGALTAEVHRVCEQGESIGAQHTFLLEQQSEIVREQGRIARELVDLRESVKAITDAPPPMPRDRQPSITSEARAVQTESMRVAAESMATTAKANKWTPWLVAGAVTAGTFFSTLANSCAFIPHH